MPARDGFSRFGRLLLLLLIATSLAGSTISPAASALAQQRDGKTAPTMSAPPVKGQAQLPDSSAPRQANQAGSGLVSAWGNNYYGQLGSNTNNGGDTPNPIPAQISDPSRVIAISAGQDHTLAGSATAPSGPGAPTATASWATAATTQCRSQLPGAGGRPDRRDRQLAAGRAIPGAQERRHRLGLGRERLSPVGDSTDHRSGVHPTPCRLAA